MIKLNTDKGIVVVTSWDDICQRPGFRARVDPTTSKLKAIIASYQLKAQIHCGLPCNQPHNKGYLVVTEDGSETAIGNVCGRTHFSVNFEEMRRKFDRDLERLERQETIRRFKAQLPDHERRLQILKDRGAAHLYRLSRPLVEPGTIPSRVLAAIDSLIRKGSTVVVREREATEDELQLLETRQGRRVERPQYVQEELGRLQGLAFLTAPFDLRRLISLDLEVMLERIRGFDEVNAKDRELASLAKWIGEAEEKFQRVEQAIEHGRRLLNQGNLKSLSGLLQTKTERTAYLTYWRSLPSLAL